MTDILDWRDQRIDVVLRQTGKTIDQLCTLPPRELVRLCGERIVAYRLVERSSTRDKPAMMIDVALSEIAEFIVDDEALRDSFVRAISSRIADWVSFQRAYKLRLEAGGWRPPELAIGNGYGTRIWNVMCDNGWSLKEMASKTDSQLLNLPNMGRKTILRLRQLTEEKV